jgi:hypothetical protein
MKSAIGHARAAGTRISQSYHSPKGENIMSGNGKRDKGNKEQKKKAKHDIKEKRKLKKEKKQKNPFAPA